MPALRGVNGIRSGGDRVQGMPEKAAPPRRSQEQVPWARLISLCLAVIYLAAIAWVVPEPHVWRMILLTTASAALIWFPKQIGFDGGGVNWILRPIQQSVPELFMVLGWIGLGVAAILLAAFALGAI